MPDPDHLRRAADHLAAAADTAEGDASERLDGIADQCRSLAERSRGPDHGRLARIQTTLGEVSEGLGDEAADHVATAREALAAYREDVEGV